MRYLRFSSNGDALKLGRYADLLFCVFCAGYTCAYALLLFYLPGHPPMGGPDEPMHRDIVEFLVAHQTWPDFDSASLLRAPNGVSYATGSSFGYWLHAAGVWLFGLHRLGSAVLFICIMVGIALCYRMNRGAGILALALLTPQVVFIFSYENSDAWTFFVGLGLGIAAVLITGPQATWRVWLLACFAALVPSTRFHLWPLAFLVFALGIYSGWHNIRALSRQQLFAATAMAIGLASWWPVTSYLHNGGDPIGLRATQDNVLEFGQAASQSIPLATFPWRDFFINTSRSFYGIWGWMSVPLTDTSYRIVSLLTVGLLGCSTFVVAKKQLFFGLLLLALNVALLIVYGSNHDYQPQGRYLFGAYALLAGMSVGGALQTGALTRVNRLAVHGTVLFLWLITSANTLSLAQLLQRSGISTNPLYGYFSADIVSVLGCPKRAPAQV